MLRYIFFHKEFVYDIAIGKYLGLELIRYIIRRLLNINL
jgi:hypothetical protein